MSGLPSVRVLGGGPDAEHDVSVESATNIANALEARGHRVELMIRREFSAETLSTGQFDVVFPALHGPWGEGGPCQQMLEHIGCVYVGSGPRAAAIGMDKIATKLAAAKLGVSTPAASVLNPASAASAVPCPLVLKPIHEGSSVGLAICKTEAEYTDARVRLAESRVAFMAEQAISGRELTVGLLGSPGGILQPLPSIEIKPTTGVYDFEAKYTREDTVYDVAPSLDPAIIASMQSAAAGVANEIGVRDLARVDFLLDANNQPWFLELNTMPGFTAHSLLPMAAAHAGIPFNELCGRLVEAASSRQRAANQG